MRLRTFRSAAFLVVVILLSACGGGGGNGAASSPGGGSGAIAATRSLPGYSVSAIRTSALHAGATCEIRVRVTPDTGQPAVQAVAGWLGAEVFAPPMAVSAAIVVAGKADTWQMVLVVPDPQPVDATVWVRLTTADGAIMEVGRDAFRLATLPSPGGG
jgi:hypothetical protein